MNLSDYIALDGTDLAKLVEKKEVTKEELINASFAQLDKVNGELNAVTSTRKEKVLAESKIDRNQAPFDGVPIFLKDISQSIQGEINTGGARLLQKAMAPNTSHFVRKLHDAGCLSLGYSTTPEFALKNITEAKIHGPTRNPWNKNHSPGGSSGGAAALVASGVVPIAGASDGGGSIRIPASFSGLFGLKPTRGRTPVGPGVGRQWQGAAIDFVLTKSVRDSARMLNVLQVVQQEAAFHTSLFEGQYEEVMKQGFDKPLKIGFTTKSPVNTPVSDDAKEAVKKTVTWLEEQGHFIEEADNEVDGIQLMRDYFLMNSGEISALMMQLEGMMKEKVTANDVEIETWLLHVAGKNVSAAEFSLSLASWDVAAAKMAAFHDTYDLYITPATAFTAPKIGELTQHSKKETELRHQMEWSDPQEQQDLIYKMFLPSLTYTPFTQLANLTGQPAMSMPVHVSEEGLPIGVQVMAPKGEEHQLLKLAFQLEQTSLWNGLKGNPYFI